MATYNSGTDTITITGTSGSPDTPATIVTAVANTAKAYFIDGAQKLCVINCATMLNGTGYLSFPADSTTYFLQTYWNKAGTTGGIILNQRCQVFQYSTSTSVQTDGNLGMLTGFVVQAFQDSAGKNPLWQYNGQYRYDFFEANISVATPTFTITGLDLATVGTFSGSGVSTSLKLYTSSTSSVSNLRVFNRSSLAPELQFLSGTFTGVYLFVTTVSMSATSGQTITLDYPVFDFNGSSSPIATKANATGSTINIQDPTFPNGAWNGAWNHALPTNVTVPLSYSDTETYLAGVTPVVMRQQWKRNDGTIITATANGSGVTPRTLLLTSQWVPSTTTTYTWTSIARAYGYIRLGSEMLYSAEAFTGQLIATNQCALVPYLTLSESAAGALTGIAIVASGSTGGTVTVSSNHTIDEVWMYYRYFISQFTNFTSNDTWTYSANTLSIGAWNIVVNGGVTLSSGTQFSSLTTTGTATISGILSTNTIVTNGSGQKNGWITLNVPAGSQVLINDQTGTQVSYDSSSSGVDYAYVPSGTSGSYSYTVRKYGYTQQTGSINISSGGLFSVNITLLPDPGITQGTLATVQAYTTLENPDKLYDYTSYYLTTSVGISQPAISKSGSGANFGAYNITIDAAAGSAFAFSSGTITAKATAFNAGSTYAGFITTGSVSVANGAIINTWYTYSGGTSVLILAPNILNGSYYQLYDITSSTLLTSGTAGSSGVYYRTLYSGSDTISLKTAFYSGLTGYLPTQSNNIITNTGVTFLDSQVLDSVYNSNAINGSTITEYTTDYVHIYIDVSVGNSSPQRLYAWYSYQLMTSAGMTNYFQGILAVDAGNYQINHSVANILLYNTTAATVAFITGAALYRDDGSVPVAATTTGAIVIFNGKSVVVGVSGLTTAQNQSLNFIKTLTSFIAVK